MNAAEKNLQSRLAAAHSAVAALSKTAHKVWAQDVAEGRRAAAEKTLQASLDDLADVLTGLIRQAEKAYFIDLAEEDEPAVLEPYLIDLVPSVAEAPAEPEPVHPTMVTGSCDLCGKFAADVFMDPVTMADGASGWRCLDRKACGQRRDQREAKNAAIDAALEPLTDCLEPESPLAVDGSRPRLRHLLGTRHVLPEDAPRAPGVQLYNYVAPPVRHVLPEDAPTESQVGDRVRIVECMKANPQHQDETGIVIGHEGDGSLAVRVENAQDVCWAKAWSRVDALGVIAAVTA